MTLPGFVHDVSSAIHPLALASPFLRTLDLGRYGLEWVFPPAELAHPFEDGTAVVLHRSALATAETMGEDGASYRRMMEPLVAHWESLSMALMSTLRLPRHPLVLARFALRAARSASGLARATFKGEKARAFFGGMACHSMLPLEQPPTAAFGLILGMTGHATGWPMPRGGSQGLANAMVGCFRSLGGEVATGVRVKSVDELPPSRTVLLDVTPRQLLAMAGHRLPTGYKRRLERYRYGPAAFKMDWALDGPIPWAADECARAGTVHLGGTLEEIAASERAVWRGEHPERPFVILAQQSRFDPTRAPEGKHTAWAYCHVPSGSTFDMTERIEDQIERFAPGFRRLVLARNVMPPAKLEEDNANLVDGTVTGGVHDFRQLFGRPVFQLAPYSTPARGLYLCSASTPPGGGVHGMSGYLAALAALRDNTRA